MKFNIPASRGIHVRTSNTFKKKITKTFRNTYTNIASWITNGRTKRYFSVDRTTIVNPMKSSKSMGSSNIGETWNFKNHIIRRCRTTFEVGASPIISPFVVLTLPRTTFFTAVGTSIFIFHDGVNKILTFKNSGDGDWKLAPRMKHPRKYPHIIVLDGKLYVIGGLRFKISYRWFKISITCLYRGFWPWYWNLGMLA